MLIAIEWALVEGTESVTEILPTPSYISGCIRNQTSLLSLLLGQ